MPTFVTVKLMEAGLKEPPAVPVEKKPFAGMTSRASGEKMNGMGAEAFPLAVTASEYSN